MKEGTNCRFMASLMAGQAPCCSVMPLSPPLPGSGIGAANSRHQQAKS